MLATLESELIDLIKNSEVAAFLKTVAALPALTTEAIQRISTTAPAIYIIAGDLSIGDLTISISFDLLCFARNAAGDNAARIGDSTTIGLYSIMDAMTGVFYSASTQSATWTATKGKFLYGDWQKMGLMPGVISVNTVVTRDNLNVSQMGDFQTFAGFYDIEPFSGSTEHDKWLEEPSDFTTSSPDLTDTINL